MALLAADYYTVLKSSRDSSHGGGGSVVDVGEFHHFECRELGEGPSVGDFVGEWGNGLKMKIASRSIVCDRVVGSAVAVGDQLPHVGTLRARRDGRDLLIIGGLKVGSVVAFVQGKRTR